MEKDPPDCKIEKDPREYDDYWILIDDGWSNGEMESLFDPLHDFLEYYDEVISNLYSLVDKLDCSPDNEDASMKSINQINDVLIKGYNEGFFDESDIDEYREMAEEALKKDYKSRRDMINQKIKSSGKDEMDALREEKYSVNLQRLKLTCLIYTGAEEIY